jgi:pimeloyl-ACP methyl ester carboxylesterase
MSQTQAATADDTPEDPHGDGARAEPGSELLDGDVMDPIQGPVLDAPLSADAIEAPRLARHQVVLADGHRVGVAVAGHGVPLVVVHGFSAEGFLYAQSLSRLVKMGFRVIAIDTAGHGATQGLPLSGQSLNDYADLLGRVVDELGIERFVVAGHSMGGQLITRMAAERPDRVIGVVLIDAIVGDTWDHMVQLFRVAPPLMNVMGGLLLVDSLTVVPAFSDPRQAVKLIRLVAPTLVGHVLQPWRLLGPMWTILRSRASRYALDALHEHDVPVFVLHGSWDLAVPMRTARDTASRTDGVLVTIEHAGHSWLLRDPETLPAIVAELLAAELGDAIRTSLRAAGLRSAHPTIAQIERVCYRPDAKVQSLTPADSSTKVVGRHRRPRYRWSTQR